MMPHAITPRTPAASNGQLTQSQVRSDASCTLT
jgi:hypothetical protein